METDLKLRQTASAIRQVQVTGEGDYEEDDISAGGVLVLEPFCIDDLRFRLTEPPEQ